MTAINLSYDEEETRRFVKQKAIALALTVGGIVFVLVALALVAGLPVALDHLGLGLIGRVVAQVLRWVLLVGVVIVSLAVVYRIAPDRDRPRFRWVSPGALVATLMWLLGSFAFSVYVSLFGHYNKVYGALAGVIVLMLWLYLSCYVVLLGAEINAESERQTVRDSTVGPPQPLGCRGAEAADTVASEAD
jgi:membrane protein